MILAVKAYALDQALNDLDPAIGPNTMVVPLLNGMRHIDLLIERHGEAPVLGGVCIVTTTLDPQGRIVQLADMQELIYGFLCSKVCKATWAHVALHTFEKEPHSRRERGAC